MRRNRGATSSILADYLIEFSNSKSVENDLKDKDILESQRLRREVLPPMWDVYEKSVSEKENLLFGKNIFQALISEILVSFVLHQFGIFSESEVFSPN